MSKSGDHNARETEWARLMAAAQDGDGEAYARLLAELLPLLRALVRSRWRLDQDVEDIVQEILISLHSVRHTYDPRRPFMPWLMAIVSRRIVDAVRRAHRKMANETNVDVMPETFPGRATKCEQEEHCEHQEVVRLALSALPPGQRRALELLKIEGLSLKEASAVTGMSIVSLKVAVHRALRAVRRQVERNA